MKNLFKFVLIGTLFMTIGAQTVQAKIITNKTTATIPQDEVVDDDLYIAGQAVRIQGQINGDVYAAGGSVYVSGVINGDLLTAGGNVTINNAQITDDLRTAGGNVTITNTSIGDNASLAGGNVTLSPDSVVQGALNFGAGMIDIAGTINRSTTGAGGSILLNGNFQKNLNLAAEELSLGKTAIVNGNINYTSQNELTTDEQAQVSGSITRQRPDFEFSKPHKSIDQKVASERFDAIMLGFKIWSLFASFLTGAVLLHFFPKSLKKISTQIIQKPFPAFFVGIVSIILAIPLFIFLLISVVGIQLGFLMIGILTILSVIGKIFASYAIGVKLVDSLRLKISNQYLHLFIGLFAYFVLVIIPIVGWIAKLAITPTGIGAALIYIKNTSNKQKK